MDNYIQGRLINQVRRAQKCRQDLVEKSDLCFTVLLPQQQVEAALEKHQVRFRQRLYTPLVTIWTFLYQVLAADQSCRAAVARLLAFLCLGGDSSRSSKQKKGIGFPIIRLVGLIGLSCGAVLDVAMGAYSGKQTDETSLLRYSRYHESSS